MRAKVTPSIARAIASRSGVLLDWLVLNPTRKMKTRFLPDAACCSSVSQRVSCARLLSLGWEPLYPSFADGVHNVLEALEE